MSSLTLLMPGLLGSYADIPRMEQPPFPALGTLVAKAARRKFPAVSFYRILCELFDLEQPVGGDLPIAPLSRLIDGLETPAGVWMRADPVHLAAGQTGLHLADASALVLSQHDAIILAAALEDFFKEHGWVLEVPLPDRWYIRLPRLPAVTTTELDRVVGRDIQPWLPAGEDQQDWRRLCNEIQILLHACDVNHARERRGELPVNSLWFWGIGVLPEILQRKWTRVYSDDPAAQGLAMLSGARFEAIPESLLAGAGGFDATGDILVASATPPAGAIEHDFDNWLEAMRELDQRWFVPLLQALRDGALAQVQIITDGHEFTLRRHSLLKFWRLRESIVDYLGG